MQTASLGEMQTCGCCISTFCFYVTFSLLLLLITVNLHCRHFPLIAIKFLIPVCFGNFSGYHNISAIFQLFVQLSDNFICVSFRNAKHINDILCSYHIIFIHLPPSSCTDAVYCQGLVLVFIFILTYLL